MPEWLSEAKAATAPSTHDRRQRDPLHRTSPCAVYPVPPTEYKLWLPLPRRRWPSLAGRRAGLRPRNGLTSLGIASGLADLVAKPLTTDGAPRGRRSRAPRAATSKCRARAPSPPPYCCASAFADRAANAQPMLSAPVAGPGDAGRILQSPHGCPRSRRRARRCIHRVERAELTAAAGPLERAATGRRQRRGLRRIRCRCHAGTRRIRATVAGVANNSAPIRHLRPWTWYRFGTGRIVRYVRCVPSAGQEGRMGRVGTHMAVVSAGWGPSGRRFKSCLPDIPKAASEAGFRLVLAAVRSRVVFVYWLGRLL